MRIENYFRRSSLEKTICSLISLDLQTSGSTKQEQGADMCKPINHFCTRSVPMKPQRKIHKKVSIAGGRTGAGVHSRESLDPLILSVAVVGAQELRSIGRNLDLSPKK